MIQNHPRSEIMKAIDVVFVIKYEKTSLSYFLITFFTLCGSKLIVS